MKFIFTFGSSHLESFDVNPMKVMLVVHADSEFEARNKVFKFDGIKDKFCTSYPYVPTYVDEFRNEYFMEEYTLQDLERLRK